MSEIENLGAPLQVGAALKRAYSAFLANFVSFNLLGLLVGIPGLLLIVLMVFALGLGAFALLPVDGTAEAELPDFGIVHFLGMIGIGVLGLSIPYIMVAVVVHGTLQHLRGNKPRVFSSLKAGLHRVVPVVLVSFIVGVLFSVGWMLFVIPGVIIALMFCVAVPVVMVEQRGVFASLTRSRALTRGQRWRILGLLLLAMALVMLVMMVLMVPVQILTALLSGYPVIGTLVKVVLLLLPLALQLFIAVFFAVLLGVIYHDLRVAKEGVSTDQIAAVFD